MKTICSLSPVTEQHYVLIVKWSSDLEFFNIETKFLHRLLDDYFIRLCNSYLVKELESTGERLLKLERDEKKAAQEIRRQLMEMKWIAANMILENKDRIKDAQVKIQFHIAQITIEFRTLKRDVFKLVEQQIYNDRQLVS